MTAQNVKLQPRSMADHSADRPHGEVPRQKPPTPEQRQAAKEAQEAKIAQSRIEAAALANQVPAAAPIENFPSVEAFVPEVVAGSGAVVAPVSPAGDNIVPAPVPVVSVVPTAPPPNVQNVLVNRPPSTIKEYLAMQNAGPEVYPEANELFSGAAGVVPESGIVVNAGRQAPPPPAPPALPPQEIIVKHEFPERASAVIVTRDITVFCDGMPLSFDRGQVITETSVIEAMMMGNPDYIQAYDMGVEMVTCPCPCGHKFSVALSNPETT